MLSTVTALALVDGLHLMAFAVVAYLLASNRPMVRASIFVAGLIGVHFAGGILLVVGWGYAAITPPPWWSTAEWALIAIIGLLALMRWRRGGFRTRIASSALRSLPATFGLGAVVSLGDLAFDVPYHLAAARIAASVPTVGGRLAWLAWFNLVYALPLLLAIGAYAARNVRRTRIMAAAGDGPASAGATAARGTLRA